MVKTTELDDTCDRPPTIGLPAGVKETLERQRQRKRQVENTLNTSKEAVATTRDMMRHYARRDLMIKRTIPQWSPWAISGAVFTLAAVNTIAAQATGDAFITGAYTLSGAVATLGLAAAAIKRRVRFARMLIPTSANQRRWMMLCAGAALIWLTAAVVAGLNVDTTGPLLGATLMVGTVVLSRTHWQSHRIPDPTGSPVVGDTTPLLRITSSDDTPESTDTDNNGDGNEGEDDPDGLPEDVQYYIDQWEKVVAAHGPVKNSELVWDDYIYGGEGEDGNPIVIGKRYWLHLPEVGVTFAGVLASKPQLEVTLGRPSHEINVERVQPTDDNPSPNPRIIQFEIIDNSPTRKPVLMSGPRYHCERDEHGRIVNAWVECGPYENGDGQATWRVYSGGDSTWGGFILGGTGSGKSVLFDQLAFSLASSGHTTIWYIDGQGGNSSPFLDTVADWPAYKQGDWDDMLSALEHIAHMRAMEQKKAAKEDPTQRGFTPTPQRPGIAVFVDECQLVLNPDNAKRWEHLSRIARKVGIALIMATQAAQYDSFGRSMSLREQIMTGNVLVLRTTGVTQSGFIPGLEMDPTALPAIPGYGYTVATKGHGRTAPFRSVFCPNFPRLWEVLELSTTDLDRRSCGAANKATENRYMHRFTRAEEDYANIELELEEYDAAADGIDDSDLDTSEPQGTSRAGADSDDGMNDILSSLEPDPDQEGRKQELSALLAEFEAEIEAEPEADQEPVASGGGTVNEVLDQLNDTQRRALDYVVEETRQGRWAASGDIYAAAGVNRSQGHQVVVALSQMGLVSNQGKGKYGLTMDMEAEVSAAVAP